MKSLIQTLSKAPTWSLMAALAFALTQSVACPGGGVAENADTYAQGDSKYKDAQTTPQGQPQPAAKPEPQPAESPMTVEIHIAGSGSLSGLRPECSFEGATGHFVGLLSGEGEIDPDGAYFAGLASTEGQFTTPSGHCDIPDVSISSLTEVSIKAKLVNTQRNCQTYCQAKARSAAESQCQGSSDEVSCRSSAEASYETSCQRSCSGTTTRRIVAETSLGLQGLAELNAHQLGVSGLGTINANLTFDHIEDDSTGNTVAEQ